MYRGALGYTEVHWDIQRCTGIYRGALGYTEVYEVYLELQQEQLEQF